MKTYDFVEAVEVLKTSETTLSELLNKGVIAAAKFGQSWCIPEENIDAHIRSEVARQTSERVESISRGEKPKVATARGNLRTVKPDLDKIAA
ncbi:MAG TPA: helix-turn-helix domain-containing protein [Methylotenera sp.]|nr:helix-turn-helix domain-containing protein [Methylotenera sp.]